MTKIIIKTPKAPLPIGPYHQAIVAGNFVFLSGQIPIDPKTGEFVAGGIGEQTRQNFLNIKAVLEEAGTSLDNIVKSTVFLKDMNDFAAMNAVYKEFITEKTAPARSTIQVARLPKDALVEIEIVAVI